MLSLWPYSNWEETKEGTTTQYYVLRTVLEIFVFVLLYIGLILVKPLEFIVCVCVSF